MSNTTTTYKIRLAATTAGLSALLLHTVAGQAAADSAQQTHTLQPGKVQEECLRLRDSQTLHYRFSASSDLHFNVHYHEKGKQGATYVVGPQAMRQQPQANHYRSAQARVICLMWKNKGSEPVQLSYSQQLKEAEQ